jgi:WD40 repeat protein
MTMVRSLTLLVLVGCLAGVNSLVLAEDAPPPNFVDHVLPVLKARCASCHGADQAKGGFVIDSYGQVMGGGASGPVVEPGDSDASRLWLLVNHKEQPIMPPKEPKLPDDQLATIEKWIAGGALETASSKPVVKKKSSFTLNSTDVTGEKPEGDPPMPENVSVEPLTLSTRGNVVTALAANPWSPLAAVAGHRQILLYDLTDFTIAGVLPFHEGQIHVLRFSRNGTLLLAGGGQGGKSGLCVVYDVRTGARVFEVGSESDAVLAADISSNHGLVALGGPKKIVRVFSTATGEQEYELKKHTDWITAIEFSPDGVLLATGDRSNGTIVWEAPTGREFYVLNGHSTAVTGFSWRVDSNLLASCSEDTTIRLWEMTNGTQVRSWGAHGAGVASVQFTRDGRLVSTGRDLVGRIWNGEGGQIRQLPGMPDLGLKVAFCETTGYVLVGDWTGRVHVYKSDDGTEVAVLVTNPAALPARIESAAAAHATNQAAADAAAVQLAAIQKEWADKKAAYDAAAAELAAAQQALTAAQAVHTEAAGMFSRKFAAAVAAARTVAANSAVAEQAAAETEAAEAAGDANAVAAKKQAQAAADAALLTSVQALEAVLAEKNAARVVVDEATSALTPLVEAVNAAKAKAEAALAAATPNADQQAALTNANSAATSTAALAVKSKALVEKLQNQAARQPQLQAAANAAPPAAQ